MKGLGAALFVAACALMTTGETSARLRDVERTGVVTIIGGTAPAALQRVAEPAVTVDAVTVDTIPVDTVPVDTIPVDTIPAATVPLDTVPADSVPVDTVAGG